MTTASAPRLQPLVHYTGCTKLSEPQQDITAVANMEITVANTALVSLFESWLAFNFFAQYFPMKTLTSFFAIFLLFNLSIFFLYEVVIYPFLLSPLRHLPEGRGFFPLVGHELSLFQRPGGAPHLKMMKEVDNDGLILTRGFFHRNKVVVTSPAALADVLVHKSYDMEKPPWARAFLRKFLGDGLLMTEGDEYETPTYYCHAHNKY
jgi:hypothetical protein